MQDRGKAETTSSPILHEAARSTGATGTIVNRSCGMDDMLVRCWKNDGIVVTDGTEGSQRVVRDPFNGHQSMIRLASFEIWQLSAFGLVVSQSRHLQVQDVFSDRAAVRAACDTAEEQYAHNAH